MRGTKELTEIKCVVVGDHGVGKTNVLFSLGNQFFGGQLYPLNWGHNSPYVMVDGKPIRLALYDTPGHEDYDRLRPLGYPGTDVILVCFSIANPASFEHITSKWLPEIKLHMPEVPFILVGTQVDLRDADQGCRDADSRDQAWVHEFTDGSWDSRIHFRADRELVQAEAGHAKAQELGAYKYLECSALTGAGLSTEKGEVMDEASRCGLPLALATKRAQRKSRCAIC